MKRILADEYQPPKDASSDESCSSGVEEIGSDDGASEEESPGVICGNYFLLSMKRHDFTVKNKYFYGNLQKLQTYFICFYFSFE